MGPSDHKTVDSEYGSNIRKRGPRTSTMSLEKKLSKQKLKDDKEVRRVVDDMIRRVEDK